MPNQNQWVPSPLPASQTAAGSSNLEGILLPSAARTAATYNTDPIYNANARGVRIFCDVTNANGGTVTIAIQEKDPVSGNWVTNPNSTSAAFGTATQTRTLTIYPGLTTAAGTATTDTQGNSNLGVLWRLQITVATATVTFSVGGSYLL